MQKVKQMTFLLLLFTLISTGCARQSSKTDGINTDQPVQSTADSDITGQWPRIYNDALGREVTIEKQPEKIVVLHFGYTEYLMALNSPPVGVAQLETAQSFKTLNQYKEMSDFIDVGKVTAPNLEKILEIKPDLIIATPGIHDDALESLEKISTVVYKTDYGTWEETLNDYARLLGKEEVAATYIQETKDIITKTRETLASYEDKTFVFLRPDSKGGFWTPGSGQASVFYHDPETGFGLSAPKGHPTEAGNISLEALADMNPDYIFFQDNEELCRQKVKELESSGVWQSISAVQSGSVGYLDLSLNTFSPLAIRLASEQIPGFLGVENQWPRTYIDTLGREVVLEEKPKKVALIFFRNYEHLLMLNEIPFAAADVEDVYKGWASLVPFAEQYEIIDLGDMQTPNIEKLLESSPDMIIVYSGVFEKIGEQLEKIAPTVAVNNYGDDWQTPIREYGKLFAKEDMAEAEIQRLTNFLKDSAHKFQGLSDKTFGFLAPRNEKEFTVYVLNYVYDKKTGLVLNGPEGYLEKSREVISLEGVSALDPDYLFIFDNMMNSESEDYLTALGSSSVWNALKAVQNDQVYLIDRSIFSGGPISIEFGVNEILKAIGE